MSKTDQPVVIDGDTTLTYGGLQNAINHTAAQLRQHGITPDERVGICMPPDWRYLTLILAMIHEGVIACPINPALPPEAIVAHLDQIGSTNLITPVDDHSGQINPIDPVTLVSGSSTADRLSFIAHPPPFDQPATIIFTSGSVGRPKAVLHTLGNHVWNARGSNENIPFGPGDRWLLSLPLYHVSGLSILFRTVVSGATLVIPEQRGDLATAILQHGITHTSLVSTQLIRLLASEDGRRALDQLKAILLGGSAMPRAALDQAYALGLPIHISYGLSEMASQVTTTPRDVPIEKRYTSGKVLPYRQIRIQGDGLIQVRGATRFAGYVEGTDLRQPFDNQGWYTTGDLGSIDKDGYLSVAGRKDNMFVSGGENIQPEEIEAILLQIPGVEQALVVPVPDGEWGARPVAFLKPIETIEHEVIIGFLAQHLPRFKIPIAFHTWPHHLAAHGIKISRQHAAQLAVDLVDVCDGPRSN